jgi:solute:Na+ symporter, SSS family
VFGLPDQDAINLRLLGGVWILQTFPAVALGLSSRWLHRRALLVGWAAGMVAGTVAVASGGFSAVVSLAGVPVYVALAALVLNLGVAFTLTPVFERLGRADSTVPT